MTKVFIIILNFNSGRDTVECLNSLRNEKAEIVVVDNGSTDGSVEMLRELVKKNKLIKLIENKRNLGFAAGNNLGIKYAHKKGANAILLLNQDTIVEKGFLAPLLENPADIVAPVIKFKRGRKWVYDYGGKINWWLGRTTHVEGDRQNEIKNTGNIDYVSGCAMLIKRPVVKKIGLLDEKFFLYFEDADFCLKAKKAGFKIAVEPKSIIFHKLAEGKKKPLKQQFHLLKSNLIFINRYIPFWKRPLAYFYWWILSSKILLTTFL